ncbi:stalk domain-containing protein [Paenibacillus sp. NPDC058174]|uniref:stalk domain-containing protein n=1 Tax=Paenibacillus sp. NPDC058174 TaxID=3346366 RepID=UPI0036DC469C
MKKTIISILTLAMLLVTNASVFAAQEQKVSLGFNKVTVKLNGKVFKGNNISYDGTTYVPIRNISALLKFPVHYYSSTKTAYIGTVPAGEVPESVLKDWAAMDAKSSSSSSTEKLEKKRDAKVTVKINDITVKVNGKKVASNNLVYNGTTYAPMRAVATMLGINVYFHEPTSTAYLGTVPKDELTAAPPKKSTNMYDTAASGEMAGWRVLVGHEYADVARIYFKANGTIITTKVVDIRKVDYNKKVTWTDDNGIKYTNTIRELYQLFLLTSEYNSDWLHKKFGKIYDDWFIVSTIKADDIVTRYLEDTGKLKPIDDGISLRPDSEFK